MRQRLLIWLRRFRPKYGQRFRFHEALSTACTGLVYPITIQDRSYSSTLLGSFYGRSWFVLPAAFLACMVGLIFTALLSLALLPEQSAPVVFAILIAWISYISYRICRRFGYRSYTGQANLHRLLIELESIKAGRGGNVVGVDVIKCDDDIWRDVVAAALTKADIAIIDVSDVTENLAWEISRAFESLPKDRVILVCDEEANNATTLSANLNELFSATDTGVDVHRLRDEMVVYPSESARVGPWRRRQVVKFGKRLRFEIADRLLHE